MTTAAHRYYAPKHGRWRGWLRFEITSWRALFAAPMPLSFRVRIALLALGARIFGASTFETELDCSALDPSREILHRTRISKWGTTYFASEETLTVDASGADLAMRGTQRLFPTFLTSRPLTGTAHVTDTADRADYELDWLGAPLTQIARFDGETLHVEQTTPFSRSHGELRPR